MSSKTTTRPGGPLRFVVLGLLLGAVPVASAHGGLLADTPSMTLLPGDAIITTTTQTGAPIQRETPLSALDQQRFDLFQASLGQRDRRATQPQDVPVNCAEPDDSATRVVEQGGEIIVYDCPIRLYDRGYAFGNVDLAAHPTDPERFVFNSLHGPPAPSADSPRGRSGETHTAFTTTERGLDWLDEPFRAPADGSLVGVDGVIAYDSEGDVHIVDHWIMDDKGKPTSRLSAFRSDAAGAGGMIRASYLKGQVLTLGADNDVHDLGIVHLERVANTSNASNSSTMVVAWLASPHAPASTPTEAFVHVATTDARRDLRYEEVHPDEPIGPCQAMSAPVAYEGLVFVACVEGAYEADENGDRRSSGYATTSVWSLDPRTGNATRVSETDLTNGQPHLDINRFGYSVLSTGRLGDDGTPIIDVTFGWHGGDWDASRDLGTTLHGTMGSLPLRAARLTAIELSEESNTAIAIYHERRDLDVSPMLSGATAPGTGGNPGEYAKMLFSFDACDAPIVASRFDLGTAIDPLNARAYAEHPGTFDDLRDGLIVANGPDGDERVTFALNDYGAVLFGHFAGRSAAGFCPGIPPIPVVAQTVVSNPLTQSNMATQAMGAALGLGASAMVGYLLTLRRRSPHALATGA